jgi:TonB family protein
MRKFTPALTSLAFVVLTAVPLSAQQPLASARQMYASAEYEQALKTLDSLKAGGDDDEDGETVDLYRALCLLAMGRRADADHAIEAIIVRDPLFRPSDDIPPRVHAAVSDARKRMLPAIIQQQYNEAKASFEHGEFAAAAKGFEQVVAALNDSDMAPVAATPPLSDLRTLAAGFRELSVKAIPPPPPPPAPVAPAVVVNKAPRIYGAEERGVVSPVAVRQELPQFTGIVGPTGIRGVVEIVINETGGVESAMMATATGTSYDATVVVAATKWRYEPATVDGKPVKYRKRIQIQIAPGKR